LLNLYLIYIIKKILIQLLGDIANDSIYNEIGNLQSNADNARKEKTKKNQIVR
jgi:hypothetical protein